MSTRVEREYLGWAKIYLECESKCVQLQGGAQTPETHVKYNKALSLKRIAKQELDKAYAAYDKEIRTRVTDTEFELKSLAIDDDFEEVLRGL